MLTLVAEYIKELEPKLPTAYIDNNKFAIMGASDGDSTIFNGLLSTVYDRQINWPLIAVLLSQGDNGMFFRSPARRQTNNEGYDSFFSRDQAMGVLCAATCVGFPYQCWDLWLNYISKSRPCLKQKPRWLGGGCAVRSPIYKFAPDNRSDITPANWALMGRVSDFRGWEKQLEMQKWDGYDGDASILEAEYCKEGYRLHLNAVQAFIKLLTGQSRVYSMRVGKICHDRVKDNLFYEYLATRKIDHNYITRYLDMAPSTNAKFGNGWVWQSDNVADEIPYSSGWDFIFLGKLILKFYGQVI